MLERNLDINAKMLRAGQKRMKQTMYWGGSQLAFQLGNAEQLSSSIPPTFGNSPQQTEASNAKAKLPSNTSPLPALPTIPIPDNSIDLYTIAFGIRNCTHIDQVLSEAHRVLKPGGIFACLEFGKVNVPMLAE
jgi:2-methoxy-6-polyprenyl-1,4-benzoquinol methylase